VRPGATRHITRGCRTRERLATSTEAIGFYGKRPPSRALARAVHVRHDTANGRVKVTIRGGAPVRGGHAVVQLDLLCAGRA
jgi:predicted sugar kinase